MKLKFYLFTLLFCYSVSTIGQIITDIPVVDIDIESVEVESYCYCQPGVQNKSRSKGLVFRYGNRGSGRLVNENRDPNDLNSKYTKWDNLELKLKAPLLIKDHFKLLLGYSYYQEGFNFSEISMAHFPTISKLDQMNLKSSSFSLIVNKSLDERRYLAFQFRYAVSGNFSGIANFRNRYAIYRFLGIYGVKPNDDLEWGFALNISKSFRRFNIIPLFLYNKNFSAKWGIEALLPGFIHIRNNISPSSIVLGGLEFGNKNFRFEVPQDGEPDLDYAYNQSHLKAIIKYEQRIMPWVWVGAKVGYQYNLNSRFESRNEDTTSFFLRAENAPFFKLSFFLSPHSKDDKMLKSH